MGTLAVIFEVTAAFGFLERPRRLTPTSLDLEGRHRVVKRLAAPSFKSIADSSMRGSTTTSSSRRNSRQRTIRPNIGKPHQDCDFVPQGRLVRSGNVEVTLFDLLSRLV